jgi:hypothetical protein
MGIEFTEKVGPGAEAALRKEMKQLLGEMNRRRDNGDVVGARELCVEARNLATGISDRHSTSRDRLANDLDSWLGEHPAVADN